MACSVGLWCPVGSTLELLQAATGTQDAEVPHVEAGRDLLGVMVTFVRMFCIFLLCFVLQCVWKMIVYVCVVLCFVMFVCCDFCFKYNFLCKTSGKKQKKKTPEPCLADRY